MYGDRAGEAMGRTFGIGWRQVYNLARVWEVFFLGEERAFCTQVQSCPLQEVTWYVVASQTDDPRFWLGYAEDRKAENPRGTRYPTFGRRSGEWGRRGIKSILHPTVSSPSAASRGPTA